MSEKNKKIEVSVCKYNWLKLQSFICKCFIFLSLIVGAFSAGIYTSDKYIFNFSIDRFTPELQYINNQITQVDAKTYEELTYNRAEIK